MNGDRLKKGRTPDQTTLVAYLLQPDQKTPSSEVPTSVEVKIGTPKGDEVVALKASPDSADPMGSSRFVSKPGPFELNQTGGEVTVQVGGKTLSGKFCGPLAVQRPCPVRFRQAVPVDRAAEGPLDLSAPVLTL